jgi:hypothetical protein
MVINYHANPLYSSLITDPGRLNTWLKYNNGYAKNGDIIWGRIFDEYPV